MFQRCRHLNLRCVHGDEIIGRNWARTACLDCGKSLKKVPLLYYCWYTRALHGSYKNLEER